MSVMRTRSSPTACRSGAARLWLSPGAAGSTRPRPPFCDELPNRGNQLTGNFHDRLCGVVKRRLILRHRLFLGLLLVVSEHSTNSLLIPTSRKFALLHLLPFLRRRPRYAISGLPRS